MKPLKDIFHSLNDVNFLKLKSAWSKNEKPCYNVSLLKNGLKLRNELVNQWENTKTNWAFQQGDTMKSETPLKNCGRLSFLQNIEFQNLYNQVYKHQLSNPILIKTIFNNVNSSFKEEDEIVTCSDDKTFLTSEYFVPGDTALSKFYNLQRERKIWWMRFSANASRYCIEPFEFSSNDGVNDICGKSKSITIKAKFAFGMVSMEHITLVPLHEFNVLNPTLKKTSSKISLLRSVIDLDFTTSALILDAFETGNNAMMLNPKLAPYQILLASMHKGNEVVDELLLHLKYVFSRISLRLCDEHIYVTNMSEFERRIELFDKLGVPYALVVDDESVQNGLIRLRSRDTTLFETIHISDLPNYILSLF